MPRVNLGRDPRAERQEATRRIIRRGMAEQGMRYDMELAGKTLRLTPDDAAVMLGIKK